MQEEEEANFKPPLFKHNPKNFTVILPYFTPTITKFYGLKKYTITINKQSIDNLL